jgi:hypothetical protein
MRAQKVATIALAALITSACFSGAASAENAFTDYLDATRAHFLTGLNSVVTVPADPVMGLAEPPKEYTKIPGVVPGHVLGAIQGVILGAYRGTMGALDMAFAPFPMAILSPEPRYQPIPGFDWDE